MKSKTGFLYAFRRESASDKLFHIAMIAFLAVGAVVVLYPMLYAVACSFSSTQAIIQGRVLLWPVEFTLDSYKAVLGYSLLRSSFLNSLLYAAGGTVVSVTLLLLAAYPLSRKDLPGRKWFMAYFVFTMFFSGGIIPNYLLISNMNLIGSRWSVMIGFMFSCYNMVIVKSYFQSVISQSLLDAAQIDGCNDLRFFFSLALPLAKPVIAVMVLFNMVNIWNSYFNAMLYLTDATTLPLQNTLRSILFIASMPQEIMGAMDQSQVESLQNLLEQLRYAILVVGALPMMVLYPFVQKFFIKGVMIGSIKE